MTHGTSNLPTARPHDEVGAKNPEGAEGTPEGGAQKSAATPIHYQRKFGPIRSSHVINTGNQKVGRCTRKRHGEVKSVFSVIRNIGFVI